MYAPVAYGTPLIAGMVSDLMILGLPAVGLWNLRLRLAQKIGIFVSLSLGLFACIIDIVRIIFVFQLTSLDDITWTHGDAMVWTAVETSAALTCTNIPAAAPLLKLARESQKRSRWFRYDLGSHMPLQNYQALKPDYGGRGLNRVMTIMRAHPGS
jgi:hypothetical protein